MRAGDGDAGMSSPVSGATVAVAVREVNQGDDRICGIVKRFDGSVCKISRRRSRVAMEYI